jgi:hypothetical protein
VRPGGTADKGIWGMQLVTEDKEDKKKTTEVSDSLLSFCFFLYFLLLLGYIQEI